MKGKLLPLGTVVMLVGGTKKVMITGYYAKGTDDSKIYTYNGCIFPEGFMENVFVLFDDFQISDVIYRGLENDESKDYAHKIQNDIELKSSPISGKVDNSDNKSSDSSERRVMVAPTKPLSKGEMMAKYGVKKMSGNGNRSDI